MVARWTLDPAVQVRVLVPQPMENNMHYERGQSIFSMLGGFEPSRAANPSEGNDPVSLGMLPAARGVAVPSAPPPAAPPPAEPAPQLVSAEPVAPPPNEDIVLLNRNVAIMQGKAVQLLPEHVQYIVAVLMNALEISMANELIMMRQAYGLLQNPELEQTMRQGNNGDGMVREVQGETPEASSPPPTQDASPPVHQVRETKDRKRGLRLVPDRDKGEAPTAPDA
jgi:hypothetical protein